MEFRVSVPYVRLRSPTLRMSHEGERATDARMQDEPDRALPHWLNPLGSVIQSIKRCACLPVLTGVVGVREPRGVFLKAHHQGD